MTANGVEGLRIVERDELETVTEGEIFDAIHRVPGARSLDGIKRRVRAPR